MDRSSSPLVAETTKVLKDGRIEITRVQEIKRFVDVPALEVERDSLAGVDKPSDKETLELAKQGVIHEYYNPERLGRVYELDNLIKEYNDILTLDASSTK